MFSSYFMTGLQRKIIWKLNIITKPKIVTFFSVFAPALCNRKSYNRVTYNSSQFCIYISPLTPSGRVWASLMFSRIKLRWRLGYPSSSFKRTVRFYPSILEARHHAVRKPMPVLNFQRPHRARWTLQPHLGIQLLHL